MWERWSHNAGRLLKKWTRGGGKYRNALIDHPKKFTPKPRPNQFGKFEWIVGIRPNQKRTLKTTAVADKEKQPFRGIEESEKNRSRA